MKRTTQILVALVGMLLVSVIGFSGTASAEFYATFTVSPERAAVGETITVTDTTPNPEGLDFTYEWAKTGYPASYDVRAGSPECLNADCSQAQWTYATPGMYEIRMAVKWSSNPEDSKGTYQRVTIVAAGEAPAPILLASPTTVSLPTVLEVLSPKRHMRFGGCIQKNLGEVAGYCEPYLIKRTGPDTGGFYHYRFRFVLVQPGPVEVGFSAWNKDPSQTDYQTFDLNVTGNAYRFGDVRSCHWPFLRKPNGDQVTTPGRLPVRNVYDLYFYSEKNARVTVSLQIREDGHWVTTQKRRKQFSGLVYSPWSRKQMRIPFESPSSNRRITYEIKNGRKLLKRGMFSTKRCAF